MSCESCISLGIPEHLCSFNKEEPVSFVEDELLYRRFHNNIPKNVNELTAEHLNKMFPLRNDSYNRSNLSKPQDVFIDENGIKYNDHFCASFSISRINSITINVPDNSSALRLFSLLVRIDKKDCNYAHCEIDCYMNGLLIDPNKNPRSAKMFMRNQLKRLLRFE